MSLCKQAKTLSKAQQSAILAYLGQTRLPERNVVIFLLSFRAGLRAKEIASITWGMVTDADGNICDSINLTNNASKGRSGGTIWLNDDLKTALEKLKKRLVSDFDENKHIIISERGNSVSAQIIVNMFYLLYKKLGFRGCSSHSGRRTFITSLAKRISTVGGSMRDVQMLARHSSLSMTQRYIDADIDAQKKVVNLV
jgi:integrase